MSEEKVYKKEKKQEMTLEESKTYRASLYKEEAVKLDEGQKKECFRLYWAENKSKFGKAKDLEEILWVHLLSSKNSDPENFKRGLIHFGLVEIKK